MKKRVIIATVLGIIAGILCYAGGTMSGVNFTTGMTLGTILNRAVIGFLIGVSAWKIGWVLHGILMGAIGGSPLWLAAIDSGINSLLILLVFSVVWGFLIELVTTKVLKAPQR
jgi:hypothetical protein